MVEPFISGYWGKARRNSAEGPEWHPAAYHGLDVAAAGHAVLEVRPQYLNALVMATGLPRDVTQGWFLLSLALHDLGKFAALCRKRTKILG